jgi:hypothetical protein
MKLLLALFLAVSPLLAEKVTFLTPSTPIQVPVSRDGTIKLKLRYFVQCEKPSDFSIQPFIGIIQNASRGPSDWPLPTPRRFGPSTVITQTMFFPKVAQARAGQTTTIYLFPTYAGQPGLPIHSVALVSDDE